MQKLFNKILVPIDFSVKSKVAIDRAVDIAKEYHCSIHLFHVVAGLPFEAVKMAEGHMAIPYGIIENKIELEFHLQKLCDSITMLTSDSLDISYSIARGYWDDAIIDLVKQSGFDLVIIGQKGLSITKRKMLLNPDKIASKTNVPVITIPSNRRIIKLYSIVIPITDFLPVKKLMYGIYIATTYKATIKLLGIKNSRTQDQVEYYLKKSKDLVLENCKLNVETDMIRSDNTAEAVNQFAMLQAADLIIVNPGTQTKMPGFLSTMLGNIIQKYATPPVLTINPA